MQDLIIYNESQVLVQSSGKTYQETRKILLLTTVKQ